MRRGSWALRCFNGRESHVKVGGCAPHFVSLQGSFLPVVATPQICHGDPQTWEKNLRTRFRRCAVDRGTQALPRKVSAAVDFLCGLAVHALLR
jgi:hypothetical protein